jgi:hypothetical protein
LRKKLDLALPATGTSAAAVVVVAEHYSQARFALGDLPIAWDEGSNVAYESQEHRRFGPRPSAAAVGIDSAEAGDINLAFARPPSLLEADYDAPLWRMPPRGDDELHGAGAHRQGLRDARRPLFGEPGNGKVARKMRRA